MVLDAEGGNIEKPDALRRLVVEVDMRKLDAPKYRIIHSWHGGTRNRGPQAVEHDTEAMVLNGYLHTPRAQILDGMISPMVPELQLLYTCACRTGDKLVAHADAKDWNAAKELLDRFACWADCVWISWSIGDKDTMGIFG